MISIYLCEYIISFFFTELGVKGWRTKENPSPIPKGKEFEKGK
jgi:hypothetical protein